MSSREEMVLRPESPLPNRIKQKKTEYGNASGPIYYI